MKTYRLEYRVIDNQLCSGHTNRHGVFVDVRPVSFKVTWTPLHKNCEVNVRAFDGRDKHGVSLKGTIFSDSVVSVSFHGNKVWVPYDSSGIPTEEEFVQKHKVAIDYHNACREHRKSFDAGYGTIDLIASTWLLEAPKQARRFSSGVQSITDELLMEKIFGTEFASKLLPHEIKWCKTKLKKELNILLNKK